MLDAIVIGGGPAGATAASILAMDGRRVALVERERFPRYHIGESLLPATVHGVCRILGVSKELEEAGFVRKLGGSFRWGANPNIWTFAFGDQMAIPEADFAYQVERSKFDEILLRNARRLGVDVREGCAATRALRGERYEGIAYTDEAGNEHELRARYVVDASGGSGLLANDVGDRSYDEFFRNLALFGYFRGGRRLEGTRAGNILTVAFRDGWFWYIPLRDDLTSVGAVLPKENVALVRHGDRREALRALIDRCPLIAEMVGDAEPVTDGPYGSVRLLRDFSYTNETFYRGGAVLVGDAACFIDPVFSSGVHLATLAGLMAARSINSCLSGDLSESVAFREFERRYRREYGVFYQFLVGFYEIHHDPESYFWNARKLVNAAESNRDAFIRLVSGLASAEPRFHSQEAFVESTLEQSRVLDAATRIEDKWSSRDSELAGRAAEHIAVLGRERRELLIESGRPVFSDGLVPTADQLRWMCPAPIESNIESGSSVSAE
jgi:halogenation protein CepH